jgi:hypothetical protein
MRRAASRALLAGGLALPLACDAASDDPLDRETVAAIAKSIGDGRSTARSGNWSVTATVGECECDVLFATRVCVPMQLADIPVAVDLVEGGGFLVMRGPLIGPTSGIDYEATGAIAADGAFELGYVEVVLSLTAELLTVARVDGEFAADDAAFSATMQIRASGRLGDIDDACETELALEGERGLF